jgi:hypothetical protein
MVDEIEPGCFRQPRIAKKAAPKAAKLKKLNVGVVRGMVAGYGT